LQILSAAVFCFGSRWFLYWSRALPVFCFVGKIRGLPEIAGLAWFLDLLFTCLLCAALT
jgi:hypothetical protein